MFNLGLCFYFPGVEIRQT